MYGDSHQALPLHCTSLCVCVCVFQTRLQERSTQRSPVFRFGPACKPRCCQAVTPAQLGDASAAERSLSEVQRVTSLLFFNQAALKMSTPPTHICPLFLSFFFFQQVYRGKIAESIFFCTSLCVCKINILSPCHKLII